MFCKNCGKELIPGKRFCGSCGAPVEQIQQPAVQNAPVQSQSAPDKQEKKDNKTKKIVAIILVIVIILISCAVGFAVIYNKNRDKREEEALRKAVEDYTTKQILTFYYEDYDADGNKEAFAIAGDGEEESFKKADIIYVDRKKKPKTVDSDIDGHTNGMIYDGSTKFISVEKETKQAEKSPETTTAAANQTTEQAQEAQSKSFVYGVKEEEVFEPEISGKYANVHQEDEKIVAEDPETGNEIVLSVDSDGELVTGKGDKGGSDKTTTTAPQKLTPAKQDYEQLEEIIDRLMWAGYYYNSDTVFDHNKVSATEFFKKAFIQDHACLYDIFFFKDNFNETYWNNYHSENPDPYFKVQDPLKIFENDPETVHLVNDKRTYNYNGRVFKKENVDFIMKEVFNLSETYTPPEKELIEGFFSYCYYYDNNYYCIFYGDYGDATPTFEAVDYTEQDDGRYRVRVKVTEYDDSDGGYCYVTANLKEKDGMRYWSIYEIKKDN